MTSASECAGQTPRGAKQAEIARTTCKALHGAGRLLCTAALAGLVHSYHSSQTCMATAREASCKTPHVPALADCQALHCALEELSTLNRVATYMTRSQDQVYSFVLPTPQLSQDRTAVTLKHPPVAKHAALCHALGELYACRRAMTPIARLDALLQTYPRCSLKTGDGLHL